MCKVQWLTAVFHVALIGFGLFGIILSYTAFSKELKVVEGFRYSITATVLVVVEQIVVGAWFAWHCSQKTINGCLIKTLLMFFFYSWLAVVISVKGLITVICDSSSTSTGNFCRVIKLSFTGSEGPYWSIVAYAFNFLWSFLVLLDSNDESSDINEDNQEVSMEQLP